MKFTIVFLSVAASALANIAHHPVKREHHVPAALQKKNESNQLVKRESFSGTATYYDVTPNAGACGDWMQPGQHVVALNSPQLNAYGGYVNGKPSSCYKSITLTGRGQTQTATIMDECPTCGWGSLDLSEGLFTLFASTNDGVFDVTWWFNDGSGGSQQQPTTTTHEYTPPPTTEQQQTTTSTSTWTPPTTSPTSTTPSPSPTSTSTTSSSSEQTIQEVPSSTPPQNLAAAPSAIQKLAALIHLAGGLA
jgi:uncharacterized protein YkwD